MSSSITPPFITTFLSSIIVVRFSGDNRSQKRYRSHRPVNRPLLGRSLSLVQRSTTENTPSELSPPRTKYLCRPRVVSSLSVTKILCGSSLFVSDRLSTLHPPSPAQSSRAISWPGTRRDNKHSNSVDGTNKSTLRINQKNEIGRAHV